MYVFSSYSNLTKQILFQLYTRTSVTEFAVVVCLFIYLPDDDFTDVETYRRNISDKLSLIIDLQFIRSNAVQPL